MPHSNRARGVVEREIAVQHFTLIVSAARDGAAAAAVGTGDAARLVRSPLSSAAGFRTTSPTSPTSSAPSPESIRGIGAETGGNPDEMVEGDQGGRERGLVT